MMALTSPQDALTWIVEKLPLATSVLLTVLIGHSLALLSWRIIAPPPEPKMEVLRDQPDFTHREIVGKPGYAEHIAKLHLFGDPPKVETPDIADAPKTRLNLTLLGVYATESNQAIAIIASGGSEEKIYQVGDAIPGGAVLKAVLPDRVLLERQSKMETLPFPRDAIKGVAFSQSASSSAPVSSTNAGTDQKLGNLRRKILKNPGQLGKMVQARPIMKNGQFEGYQLSPSGNRDDNKQLFQELGLEPGDIVTSVNDIMIDRPEKGLNALQNLVNAAEVTITLLRDGSEITLHHNVSR